MDPSVDAGLKAWLFFLLVFALLGYSAVLSIFMSAIAGLVWGMIIRWLKGTFVETTPSKPPEKERSLFSRAQQRLSRLQSWRRGNTDTQEEQPRVWFRRIRRQKPNRFRARRK